MFRVGPSVCMYVEYYIHEVKKQLVTCWLLQIWQEEWEATLWLKDTNLMKKVQITFITKSQNYIQIPYKHGGEGIYIFNEKLRIPMSLLPYTSYFLSS